MTDRKTHEFEIALATTPRSLAALARSGALRPLVRAPARKQQIETYYWDDSTLALRRTGITLRMRRTATGWLQSIKAQTGTPFLRHELEAAMPGSEPDLDLARSHAKSAGLDWPGDLVQLEPLFVTRIERTTWNLLFDDGTEAELASDRGVIVSPDAHLELRVCDVEIELGHGRVQPVYELAFRLVHDLPGTRLQLSSKADRGYAVCTGVVAPPRRARTLHVDKDWMAGELVGRAAADCLAQVQQNFHGVRQAAGRTASDITSDDATLSTDGAQYLHQMRIGVRRLRTLFRVCRAARLADTPPRLAADLKWLWRVLGAARDWDVLVQTTWPAIARNIPSEHATLAAFAAVMAEERERAHAALRRALDSRRLHQLLLALGWFFATASAKDTPRGRSLSKVARRILRKSHERVLRDGANLMHADEETRHRVRIDAKKLRYLAEFFASAYQKRTTRAYLRTLAELQEVLGALNDAAVMRTLVTSSLGKPGVAHAAVLRGVIEGFAAASQARLMSDLRPTWKAFERARPFWDTSSR